VLVEVGEPELDQGSDRVLEARLARDRERFLVARPHLLHGNALLEAVVTRHEQLLDPRPRVSGLGHGESVIASATLPPAMPWLSISAVLQVLVSAVLVTLVLMHSGREAGMGGLGFTPHSQGGTHIVERNLTRLTIVVAVVFGVNTIALFHLL
jgi:preprotein translocase subunit SecG